MELKASNIRSVLIIYLNLENFILFYFALCVCSKYTIWYV